MKTSYARPGLIRTLIAETGKLTLLGAILIGALLHLPELNLLLDGTWPW
jgi:hypothetical protein